jgi:hypothetical protein
MGGGTATGGVTTTDGTTATGESSSGGSTTSAESSSTGEPPNTCGEGGLGEAEMYGRLYKEGVAQVCEHVSRHFKVIGSEGGIVVGLPCSIDPVLGCTDCAIGEEFAFAVVTPEPDAALTLGSCVYLALRDPEPLGGEEMCRYRQAAVWSGDGAPTDSAPLAILGHRTLTVADEVTAITKADLSVKTLAVDGECGCVDPEDCCAPQTADYELEFSADQALVLSSGGAGALGFAGESYTAYNGGAYENGMCEESQRLDWWLLRD